MSPGELINSAIALREEIRADNQVLDKKKAELNRIERQIFETLTELDMTSMAGSRGTAFVTHQDIVNVDDWDKFWEYVRENDAPYFFQKRASSTAILEILNSGETIPGVTKTTIRKLGLRATT